MLSWLLQVNDSHNLLLFELFDDVVLVYQAVGEALRSNKEVCDALRVQAHDERWLRWTLSPIFMLAPFAHACQGAVALGDLVKIPRLNLRSIRFRLSRRIVLYIEMQNETNPIEN